MSSKKGIILPSQGNPALDLVGRIIEAEELARELHSLGQPTTVIAELPRVEAVKPSTVEVFTMNPPPAEPVKVEMPRFEWKTLTLDERDYKVGVNSKRWKLIESVNPGTLKELTLKSPSTAFHLTIESDGKLKLSRSYTELTEIAPYSTGIDAFEEEEIYVVHLENFNWIKKFEMTLRVTETIVFQDVWAHWKEKVEV